MAEAIGGRRWRDWRVGVGAGMAAFAAEPIFAETGRSGIDIGVAYTSDTFANVRGGIDTGIRSLGKLQLLADADLSRSGISGLKVHADVQLTHGRSLTDDLVGDGQVVSNIDAPSGLRLFEAFLSMPFGANGTIEAGLIDLNGRFDVQEHGLLFLNSSHGIGSDFSQSGLNGPSIFPTSATAVVASWSFDGWTMKAGLFDAVSGDPEHPRRTIVRFPGDSGVLGVAELSFDVGSNSEFQLGAWTYTSRFDELEAEAGAPPLRRRGNKGAYAMIESDLAKGANGSILGAWARVGLAEDDVNPIGVSLGGGITLGDEEAKWGLAVAHARLGNPAMRAAEGAADRAETNVELTYARKLGEAFTLQPNAQYVVNPGWVRGRKDALVIGLRLGVVLQ